MDDLTHPLTDEELDSLEALLLDRIDEEDIAEDNDEGVLGVSELDGFLTAIVSGPVTILPSRWLPAVWGDFDPVWRKPEDFERVLSLLVRHMNVIGGCLIEAPEEFEPMYLEHNVDGKPALVVDEWCEGYLRGVALTLDEWSAAPAEVLDLLEPIHAFTSHTGWAAHEAKDPKLVEALQHEIAPNVRAIHAYWLRQRGDDAALATPVRRETPRVGRNDPCPCGSGKKYKHCCLQ